MARDEKIYHIRYMSELSRLQNYSSYRPRQVGTFAISDEGEFMNCNTAKIPALKNFQLPLDLNEGYTPNYLDNSQWNEMETNFPQWQKVLKWIKGNGLGYSAISDIDVITQRGILLEIGYLNHAKKKENFKMEACKFNKKVYIRWVEEEEEEDKGWYLKNRYWGKRFEKYVMDQEEGIDATYKMLTGKLGDKRILISAEVDAITDDGKHMEMKTCFPHKLYDRIPLAWLQSYLGKVDILFYGLKDRHGIINKYPTKIPMAHVPGMYVDVHDANAMLGLIVDFLDWLKTALPDRNETWMLEYTGGRQIRLQKSGGKFLPGWYLRFIEKTRDRRHKSSDVDGPFTRLRTSST